MGQAYATIYVNAGTAAQALTGTPGKVTALATAGPSGGGSTGGNKGALADTANTQLKLGQGKWRVSAMLSGIVGTASLSVLGQLYKNGSALAGLAARVSTVGASGRGQLAISGVVDVAEADLTAGYATLDLRLSCQDYNFNYTPQFGELTAVQIDE